MSSETGTAGLPLSDPVNPGGGGKKGDTPDSSEFEFVGGKNIPPPTSMPPPPSSSSAAAAALLDLSPEKAEKPPLMTPGPKFSAPGAADVTMAWETFNESRDQSTMMHHLAPDSTTTAAVAPAHIPADEAANDGSSLFGWVKGASGGILSKMAQKTKASVETMITTLDPQMRDYIYSGGDVHLVVAAAAEDPEVSAVREAFQNVFGRATVVGLSSPSSFRPVSVAEQPVGFAAGKQGATERVQMLRVDKVEKEEAVLAVQGFLLEVGEDAWVEMSCLLLSDPSNRIVLTGYSQPTSVDARFVEVAKEATPDNYPKRWSGLAKSVGTVVEEQWGSETDWQQAICGVSRQETLKLAAAALAGLYQRELRRLQPQDA